MSRETLAVPKSGGLRLAAVQRLDKTEDPAYEYGAVIQTVRAPGECMERCGTIVVQSMAVIAGDAGSVPRTAVASASRLWGPWGVARATAMGEPGTDAAAHDVHGRGEAEQLDSRRSGYKFRPPGVSKFR
eukprot:SAG31_NODE_1535_length_7971_cov_7.118438_6_plen_130_part_00